MALIFFEKMKYLNAMTIAVEEARYDIALKLLNLLAKYNLTELDVSQQDVSLNYAYIFATKFQQMMFDNSTSQLAITDLTVIIDQLREIFPYTIDHDEITGYKDSSNAITKNYESNVYEKIHSIMLTINGYSRKNETTNAVRLTDEPQHFTS